MNTPSPNNNMDPSPSKLETQEPDEVDRGSEKVRRRKMWPLLLIIWSFLGLLAGLLAGGIYFSQCPKVYKSEATITIWPREKVVWELGGNDQNENPFSIRHDQFIGQDNILSKCLIKYCLQELKTLRDFPTTEQIKKIRDHLVVRQNPDEPTQYMLEFSSSNPRDSQTVLATIVATYEKHLDEKYRDSDAGRMNLLKEMSYRFHAEIKAMDRQLSEARDRAELLLIAGNPEHFQRLITELMTRIDAGKIQLAELSADLQRSQAALKNGREACLEHVWILEEAEKINRNSLQIWDNSLQLSVEMKMIEELGLMRAKLDAANDKLGPGNATIEVLSLSIKDRKEKVKELSSEGAKILAIGPEQIIQRFVVSVKQQIGDLRSTLKADLAIYRDLLVKAVKSKSALAEIDGLLDARMRVLKQLDDTDRQIYGAGSSSQQTNLPKGFLFETTRPAYRGVEVWPVFAKVLPVAGLIGFLLGLVFGCLVVLVSKAISMSRA